MEGTFGTILFTDCVGSTAKTGLEGVRRDGVIGTTCTARCCPRTHGSPIG